jgi:hypothetical protein
MDIKLTEDTFSRQWIRCRHVGCCQSWVFRVGQDVETEKARDLHEATCTYRPATR